MESEFIALESAGKEDEWLRNFLSGVPLGMQPTPSISMHCDCQEAISIAKNKAFNGENKHIRLRHEVCETIVDRWNYFHRLCKVKSEFDQSSN